MIEIKDQRGFTLVEILVVMLLIGVIFTSLLTFFTSSLNFFASGDRQTEVQQQARIAMSHMRNDLTAAREVYTTLNKNSDNLVARIERLADGEEEAVVVEYTLENRILYRKYKSSNNPVAMEIEGANVNPDSNESGLFQIQVVTEKAGARAELETTVKAQNMQ